MLATEPITVDFVLTRPGSVAESLLESAARQLLSAGDWKALEWVCAHPLTPESLLLELARFSELQDTLGHRAGPPALLEYLADHYGYLEAILTLAHMRYRDTNVSAEQFGIFLGKYAHDYQVLKALLHEMVDDNSKNPIVEEFCRSHPDAEELKRIQQRLKTIEYATSCGAEEEIRSLYLAGDPKVRLSLAGNPHTPLDLLREMSGAVAIPYANRIRHAASLNLSSRS